jgi:hypothetical protein
LIECKTESEPEWQRTPVANLLRYVSSGVYFARARIRGKLIRRSLKTTAFSVARLRLDDLLKEETRRVEAQVSVAGGKMTFGEALAKYRERLHGDHVLKPRTKDYREQRIAALLRSWPGLEEILVKKNH